MTEVQLEELEKTKWFGGSRSHEAALILAQQICQELWFGILGFTVRKQASSMS